MTEQMIGNIEPLLKAHVSTQRASNDIVRVCCARTTSFQLSAIIFRESTTSTTIGTDCDPRRQR
jgi:hypothetical protein